MGWENWRLIIKGCIIYILFVFLELMSESIRIHHTCLILDLITGQAVHTKRGVY
jgi:hypothetical protein